MQPIKLIEDVVRATDTGPFSSKTFQSNQDWLMAYKCLQLCTDYLTQTIPFSRLPLQISDMRELVECLQTEAEQFVNSIETSNRIIALQSLQWNYVFLWESYFLVRFCLQGARAGVCRDGLPDGSAETYFGYFGRSEGRPSWIPNHWIWTIPHSLVCSLHRLFVTTLAASSLLTKYIQVMCTHTFVAFCGKMHSLLFIVPPSTWFRWLLVLAGFLHDLHAFWDIRYESRFVGGQELQAPFFGEIATP